MSCIQSHAPLLPLHSQLKHKTHPRTAQLLWLPSCERTEFIQHRPNKLSLLAPRINAIPDSLVLGTSSTVKGGDISVLLPTGAVLLIAYFITNFIMPIIISKDLGLDKASEDQKRNDD